MFDINSIQVDDTSEVEILDPRTGEVLIGEGGKACTVTVYGPGSKPFAAARSSANARAVKRFRAKGRNGEMSPEEEAAAKAAMLTPITLSFNNFQYDGKENGADTFRACYLDPKMGWLTEQVNDAAGDWANFTKDAPAS